MLNFGIGIFHKNERIAADNIGIGIVREPGRNDNRFLDANIPPDKSDSLQGDLFVLVNQTPVDKMLGIAEVGKIVVILELPDGLT